LGVLLLESNNFDRAKQLFQKAIRIQPNYAPAHNNLGIIFNALEEAQKAISSYQKAIRIKPNYAHAHNNLGMVFVELGEFEKAISSYQMSVKYEPENLAYFYYLSDLKKDILDSNLKNYKNKNIISNANCSTIQLVLALKPLHDQFKIKRVIVSTYQSVSGAGNAHMNELEEQSKKVLDKQKVNSKNFTKQIAFNVIPHIDTFMEDRYTKEEWKMIVETKKILDPNISISATCVRVPVFVGHSESVNIEFKSEVNAKKIRQCLEKAPGCKVVDETKDGGYITPVESSGDFITYISRIRDDQTQKNSINMWVVSDNLLKGAALNAVQIANVLIKKYIN